MSDPDPGFLKVGTRISTQICNPLRARVCVCAKNPQTLWIRMKGAWPVAPAPLLVLSEVTLTLIILA